MEINMDATGEAGGKTSVGRIIIINLHMNDASCYTQSNKLLIKTICVLYIWAISCGFV